MFFVPIIAVLLMVASYINNGSGNDVLSGLSAIVIISGFIIGKRLFSKQLIGKILLIALYLILASYLLSVHYLYYLYQSLTSL